MPRPGKEPTPAPIPIPLTESLTIKLTLSDRDLEHFNAYREAAHALNPDNWSSDQKCEYHFKNDQLKHYEPIKVEAAKALASVLFEQAERSK